MQDIKNAAVPYNNVGLLEVRWTPLAGPEEGDENKPVRDIDSEDDLLGKPWTYKIEIKRSADLPVFCEMAYVSYDFFGEACMTGKILSVLLKKIMSNRCVLCVEAVQQTTYSPVFDYSRIHHIPNVTPEFIKYLKGSIEMQIHVNQHVDPPPDRIGTSNSVVVESIRTGEPKGYEHAEAKRPKTEAEIRCEQLNKALTSANDENARLQNRIRELELKLEQLEGNPKMRQSLQQAQLIDNIVNG